MGEVRCVDVLVGLYQAGKDDDGDDESHAQIGEPLFRQVLVKGWFLALAEEGLDDGDGVFEVALPGDQPAISRMPWWKIWKHAAMMKSTEAT